jgi:hypothetical protein
MKTRSYVFIEKLYKKILELRQAECNLIVFALRFFYYYVFYGKIILAHQKARIINPKNIVTLTKGSKLSLGIGYRGFTDKHDRTLLNIRGKLILKGSATIHKGVRIDVCEGAVLEIGPGVGINSFTKIILKKIFLSVKTLVLDGIVIF